MEGTAQLGAGLVGIIELHIAGEIPEVFGSEGIDLRVAVHDEAQCWELARTEADD